jgi:hypothetical protein
VEALLTKSPQFKYDVSLLVTRSQKKCWGTLLQLQTHPHLTCHCCLSVSKTE